MYMNLKILHTESPRLLYDTVSDTEANHFKTTKIAIHENKTVRNELQNSISSSSPYILSSTVKLLLKMYFR